MVRQVYTREEVAALFGVTVATLNRWRKDGVGPQPLKLQRRVMYPKQTVDAFLSGDTSEVPQ